MFVLPKPRVKSRWIDHELNITMIVQGIVAAGPSKGCVEVTCRSGDTDRQWTDAMPVECFATELKEIK
jgi:hypothetical protein